MHGIVHQSLKRYVVEKTDETSWQTVCERAGVEPKLYLPVTYYEDDEFDAIIEVLASMSGHDRSALERDLGRALAEPLLRTFRGHLRDRESLLDVLSSLEDATDALRKQDSEADPPQVSCSRTDDGDLRVTYRSDRDYCALARGILEGLVREFEEPATVTKVACRRTDADACVFQVALE